MWESSDRDEGKRRLKRTVTMWVELFLEMCVISCRNQSKYVMVRTYIYMDICADYEGER